MGFRFSVLVVPGRDGDRYRTIRHQHQLGFADIMAVLDDARFSGRIRNCDDSSEHDSVQAAVQSEFGCARRALQAFCLLRH